jgi:hypothetical protein
MSVCARALTTARNQAKRNGEPTDRAAFIESIGQHFRVVGYDGKTLWEGDAHCSWCARVESIKAQRSQQVLL